MAYRRRQVLRRLLAMSLGVAAAFAAGELLYRLTRVAGLSPTSHPGYVEHDPELGWRYRPDRHARHTSAEFDVAVNINPQGFRGEPWPPRDARPLVLVLGDSFAFGWGVEESESVVGQLRAQNPRWDVRGAGVSGFGTDQELLLLRRLAPQLRPDVVICVFCANDLTECASDSAYGRDKPRFELRAGTPSLVSVPGDESWLDGSSLLLRAIRKLAWQYRPHPSADWSLLGALYGAMHAATGATLIVVGDRDELAGCLAGVPKARFVDTRPLLPEGGAWWFPRDRHWNAAGHARIAAALTRIVTDDLAPAGTIVRR